LPGRGRVLKSRTEDSGTRPTVCPRKANGHKKKAILEWISNNSVIVEIHKIPELVYVVDLNPEIKPQTSILICAWYISHFKQCLHIYQWISVIYLESLKKDRDTNFMWTASIYSLTISSYEITSGKKTQICLQIFFSVISYFSFKK